MDDRTFVARFESCELRAEEFPHRAHLRLAWIYLRELPLPEGFIKLRDGIKRFAAHHGASGKYHETITFMYGVLVKERLVRCDGDFETFERVNPDLFLGGSRSILYTYYSRALLESPEARSQFVLPDLAAHVTTRDPAALI